MGCAFYVIGAELSAGRHDDEIFEHTLREFPDFATAPHASLVTLDEEWMKSKEGKERWRGFINTLRPLMLLDCSVLLTPRRRAPFF